MANFGDGYPKTESANGNENEEMWAELFRSNGNSTKDFESRASMKKKRHAKGWEEAFFNWQVVTA